MNDRELEREVKDAFDGVGLPEDVKKQALDYVLAHGQAHPQAGVQQQPGVQAQSQADMQAVSQAHGAQCDPVEFAAAMAPASRRKRGRWKAVGIAGSAVAACLVLTLAVFGVTQLPNLAPHPSESEPPATAAPAGDPAAPEPPAAGLADLETTAFVDIDINPSVQLRLNSSDCVVGAEGINDDGTRLLSSVPVDGLPYGQALRALTSSEALSPYVDGDPFIALSVSSESQDQERVLTDLSERYLADCPYRGSCNGVTQQFYDEAHSHGMGCGRYAAAVRLSELDPNVSVDDCSGMTMRELHDRIAECEAAAGQGSGAGDDSGPGQGYGQGQGYGSGSGDGAGQNGGSGSGSGQDTAPGQGYGQGQGYGHHGSHGAHHGWS